jgi:hypothetical protein
MTRDPYPNFKFKAPDKLQDCLELGVLDTWNSFMMLILAMNFAPRSIATKQRIRSGSDQMIGVQEIGAMNIFSESVAPRLIR